MEKAKFFLHEEEVELDKMVQKINRGQDEIEMYMRRQKSVLDSARTSGTKQILQALLKTMRNSDQMKGFCFFINKFKNFAEFEEGLDTDMEGSTIKFDFIKEQFLSHVDETSKKAMKKYLSAHNKKNMELDKGTQVFIKKIFFFFCKFFLFTFFFWEWGGGYMLFIFSSP